jgi:hypothetical protein
MKNGMMSCGGIEPPFDGWKPSVITIILTTLYTLYIRK